MSIFTAEPRKVLFVMWVIHLTAIGFLIASWFWVFWDHAVKYGADKVTLFTIIVLLIEVSVVTFMLFWARKKLKAELGRKIFSLNSIS